MKKSERKTSSYILRSPKPGDMGWVVHRHGVIGWKEHGFDERFEAFVASIVAKFVQNYDPKRERCWIVEVNHKVMGSVFLVKKSETVAQLRFLLIEPEARGLGIGKRLVSQCIRFARRAGYGKIVLGTDNVATTARYIYQKAGFHLIRQGPHHAFGRDLIGETWELVL